MYFKKQNVYTYTYTIFIFIYIHTYTSLLISCDFFMGIQPSRRLKNFQENEDLKVQLDALKTRDPRVAWRMLDPGTDPIGSMGMGY